MKEKKKKSFICHYNSHNTHTHISNVTTHNGGNYQSILAKTEIQKNRKDEGKRKGSENGGNAKQGTR